MSTKQSLPSNFRHMMKLLTEAGLQGRRHAYSYDYSNGRTESSKELTWLEIDRIIRDLEHDFKQFDQANTMRRKIISMAHEMDWEFPGHKADMARISAWCEKFGYLHKPLNKYSYKELPRLVTQFESVYNTFLEAI